MTGAGSRVLLAAILLAPVAARAEGDAKHGRELAEQHCSRCHVVGTFNPTGGIGSTPSLQLLVNALEDWQVRFETFFARRPHPAFVTVRNSPRLTDLPANAAPITIEPEDVQDLLAFAATLKTK